MFCFNVTTGPLLKYALLSRFRQDAETSERKAGIWQRFQNPSYMDYVSRWTLAITFTTFAVTFLAYYLTNEDVHLHYQDEKT